MALILFSSMWMPWAETTWPKEIACLEKKWNLSKLPYSFSWARSLELNVGGVHALLHLGYTQVCPQNIQPQICLLPI